MDTSMTFTTTGEVTASDWRGGLPLLRGDFVTARELRPSDAPSLCALLTAEEVARLVSPPPTTVDGFERFIDWTRRQRAAGTVACFAVTLRGFDTAIGIIQVRRLEPGFGTAEWGFMIGSAFWGTGVFEESARLVLDFVFDTLGVQRLEARAAVLNGCGNGALAEARGGARVPAAAVVPPKRRGPRPGALRDPGRRAARHARGSRHSLAAGPLIQGSPGPIFVPFNNRPASPPACFFAYLCAKLHHSKPMI